jgi:hypothetical protein
LSLQDYTVNTSVIRDGVFSCGHHGGNDQPHFVIGVAGAGDFFWRVCPVTVRDGQNLESVYDGNEKSPEMTERQGGQCIEGPDQWLYDAELGCGDTGHGYNSWFGTTLSVRERIDYV